MKQGGKPDNIIDSAVAMTATATESVKSFLKTKKLLPQDPDEKDVYRSELENESLHTLDIAEKSAFEMEEYYPQLLEISDSESEAEVYRRIDSIKRADTNLKHAYQTIHEMSDEFGSRWYDIQKTRKKRRFIPAAPPNSAIDASEDKSNHFAKGLNIYKLLLICFIGSFAGVIVELIWCFITNGYLESRSGLVYGPFNLLYGVGATALTVVLYKYRNRSSWFSFFGGLIIGSVLEYICSWAQELVFGSRSWDYSHLPLNLNGRICLQYSFFWGLLGVLWIKNIYPRMAKLILKVPNRAGKIATIVLSVFFAVNSIVTCVAIFRWTQRINDYNTDSSGVFWEFVDERFPDERMERIFANMEFSDFGKKE